MPFTLYFKSSYTSGSRDRVKYKQGVLSILIPHSILQRP